MYKILFVDDEPWAVIDILHNIPWKELGFDAIGYYEKAREAKEAILSEKPHLVFVDINMPVMNGFELIRQCREEGSNAAFVILSAYSDFEFARQAIRAAVLDYCLKPVNPAALIRMLGEIRAHLDENEAGMAGEKEAEIKSREEPAYVSEKEERFNRVLAYIKLNYRKKISLQELADHFSFSKNYICYLFRQFTGTTFSSYIIHLRIEESKALLKSTDLPLKTIAEKTGFSDCYYFCKVFKSICGTPPHKYRIQTGQGVSLHEVR